MKSTSSQDSASPTPLYRVQLRRSASQALRSAASTVSPVASGLSQSTKRGRASIKELMKATLRAKRSSLVITSVAPLTSHLHCRSQLGPVSIRCAGFDLDRFQIAGTREDGDGVTLICGDDRLELQEGAVGRGHLTRHE